MGQDKDYIHGYSVKEQSRLLEQARQLEKYIYPDIDMKGVHHLLEVGCGVGGQTEILLRRFPHIKITSVDISEKQLEVARHHLSSYVQEGRVEFVQADATKLKGLEGKSFDGAFICWFLEHAADPRAVLLRLRKVLKPEAPLWMTEVNNASFFMDPYSPNILRYWFEMNDYQWSIKGHPFIGLQLGNYLLESGYHKIRTDLRSFYFDSRDPEERNQFMKSFLSLLKSSSDNLIKDGRVSPELIQNLDHDLDEVFSAKHSVIQYGWVRAQALA